MIYVDSKRFTYLLITQTLGLPRQLVLDSTHLCRTGRGVDICRRPDVKQFDWRNHVTTFDAVRMRVPARLADWLTTLAARRRP